MRKYVDAKKLDWLKDMRDRPLEPPFVYSIHPPTEAPVIGQFEKKWPKIHAGMAAGYLSVKRAFAHPEPGSFNTESEFYGIY